MFLPASQLRRHSHSVALITGNKVQSHNAVEVFTELTLQEIKKALASLNIIIQEQELEPCFELNKTLFNIIVVLHIYNKS